MVRKKVMLGVLLLLAVLFCCPKTAITVAAEQQQFSGTCGPSAFWRVNPETKVLTISGTGAITERIPLRTTNDESYLIPNPYVEQIVIEEGITSIDANRPFIYLYSTRKITLPDTMSRISDTVFSGLGMLQSITIPRGGGADWRCRLFWHL